MTMIISGPGLIIARAVTPATIRIRSSICAFFAHGSRHLGDLFWPPRAPPAKRTLQAMTSMPPNLARQVMPRPEHR